MIIIVKYFLQYNNYVKRYFKIQHIKKIKSKSFLVVYLIKKEIYINNL